MTIFALAGLVPLMRRRSALPAALFALVWAAFFMTHSSDHVRYLLPLAVLLSLAAGAFVEVVWSWGLTARVSLLLLGLIPLVQSLRLADLLARTDTRIEGEQALAELPAESFVAIDRYGPQVDLDQQSLELLEELRLASGSYLYKRESTRLEALRAGVLEGGAHAIHLSDLFEMDELTGRVTVREGLEERLGASAEEAFKSLGVTHLLLVDRLGVGVSQSLMSEAVSGRSPALVIEPFDGGDGVVESRLPMELEFPLTSIWSLNRPGPWMGLYSLE